MTPISKFPSTLAIPINVTVKVIAVPVPLGYLFASNAMTVGYMGAMPIPAIANRMAPFSPMIMAEKLQMPEKAAKIMMESV